MRVDGKEKAECQGSLLPVISGLDRDILRESGQLVRVSTKIIAILRLAIGKVIRHP